MAKLNLHKISRTSYDALIENSALDATTIYFIEDGTIYAGGQKFGGKVEIITTDPTAPEMNTLYVNGTTLVAKIWNGTAFETITKGYTVEITDASTDDLLPTGKAVVNYVQGKIADVAASGAGVTALSYTSNGQLAMTKDGTDSTIDLTGMTYSPTYDSATRKLTIPIVGSSALEINFAKDSVVTAGKYNADTEEIWLSTAEDGSYDDETLVVKIPATELVDVYTGAETTTATTTVSADNKISVDIKVSAEVDNAITIKADGLYVAETDISGKMDVLATTNPDEVVVTKADGNVVSSGKKIGGESIAAVPDANTLATEVAVQTAANSAAATSLSSAKTYADSVAATAEQNAKDYADTIVTWTNW